MTATQPPHRKRVKHHHRPGPARELTFSCYRRFALLTDSEHKRLLTQAIERALTNHHFQLVGFVYMPEHVHLLVFPATVDADVSALLAAIKKPCSFRIKQCLSERNDPRLGQLLIRERPGRTVFRFWQEGSGYDRDIESAAALRRCLEYLHDNPVRRGLTATVGDWAWSSWHHYHADRVPEGLPTVHGMPEAELLS